MLTRSEDRVGRLLYRCLNHHLPDVLQKTFREVMGEMRLRRELKCSRHHVQIDENDSGKDQRQRQSVYKRQTHSGRDQSDIDSH